MSNKNLQVASSLDAGDCLVIEKLSSFSLRSPGEYQLYLIADAVAAGLDVGEDHFSIAGGELLMLAPDIAHRLSAGDAAGATRGGSSGRADGDIVSLRFPADLLGDRFLGKNQLQPIQELLEKSRRGLVFDAAAIAGLCEQFRTLRDKKGFAVVLGLLAFLHQLSRTPCRELLDREPAKKKAPDAASNNLETALTFMKANYSRPITLDDVARTARMTRGAFCRSIRKKTGKTYAESLTEIRIAHICRMLLETSENVSEIAYKTGFQNVNHFHRSFKRQKGCTPKEFRKLFCGGR